LAHTPSFFLSCMPLHCLLCPGVEGGCAASRGRDPCQL
jgi:hypothetical protein